MLVELAIGDAYGAGFEYAASDLVENQNNVTEYIQHPYHEIAPGCYTDDTQMSIAIAECIVNNERWNKENLASYFVKAFHRDSRKGYASRFYEFLCECEDGESFLRDIHPKSNKAGAAMRALPIGVFSTIGTVIERSTLQAKITHNTPGGIQSAVATSLMAHYFLYDLGPKEELPIFLTNNISGTWFPIWSGEVEGKGIDCVQAAITALMSSNSMSEILRNSVAFTGDVDTVATIALGAASCAKEVQQDLPQVLFDQLENGPYGLDYLRKLDTELMRCLL
jgi:ADP-ribosylglycohydrolase